MIYKVNNNYSKNINGVNINISNLDENIIIEIDNYINFCIKTHNEITKYENICNSYIDVINKDKHDEISNENIETSIKNKQRISSYMKFYLLKKKFTKNLNTPINKIDKYLTHEEYLFN
jgi:actin-like ATPase involved in cell morphogenesis